MDIDKLTIEQLVEYINSQLSKGRSMADIETNDFNVNKRVIAKRLDRRGYKRIDNMFVMVKESGKTKVIPMDKQADKNALQGKINDKAIADINSEKLMELLELIEPIKEMLEDYHRNKNIIEVSTVELKPKAVTEVRQKLFKIDVNVLEQWEEFVLNHKEFKVQQLISLALEEFIQKYN